MKKKKLLLIRFYNFKKELDDQFMKEKKNTGHASNGSIKKYLCMPSFKVYPKRIFHENKSSTTDGFL